jgi:hypothetical protein
MDAPQYVDADVPSDFFCYWMFYYKYHSDVDALQYVHVDVTSDLPVACMFYHTAHNNIYVSHCVSPGAVSLHPAH